MDQSDGAIGAGLTNDEIAVLHELLIECLVYSNPGSFDDDEKVSLANILTKVTNEAKARKFWWAR